MARIRSTGSVPERAVRSAAHSLGFRFRLHRRDLPGRPDLVFPRLRRVVFVHGCFWHQHPGCREGREPGTRPEYWHPKLRGNVERDRRVIEALTAQGWTVGVVWECQTHDRDTLRQVLAAFLGG
jgi:DNA mismatch endonuclease (patch repair protein)